MVTAKLPQYYNAHRARLGEGFYLLVTIEVDSDEKGQGKPGKLLLPSLTRSLFRVKPHRPRQPPKPLVCHLPGGKAMA